MSAVDGFRPSEQGLHYPNTWPHVPDKTFDTPFGAVHIGDASNGLCGGMVFAVRDLFESGRLPSGVTTIPSTTSPAFNYIVDRLIDSWDLPAGVAQYYEWMALPRHDTWYGLRGLSSRSIRSSMPAIRRVIDTGKPCPLGLICAHTANPAQLGENHQVLAYAYTDETTTTTVSVYDPNHPDDDGVTLRFSTMHPDHTVTFRYSTGRTVYGFFPVHYTHCDPAPLFRG